MLNLYTPVVKKIVAEDKFDEGEKLTIQYHDLFDYPLTFPELIKWKAGEGLADSGSNFEILQKNNYFFIEGREGLIYQRLLRKRVSAKKLEIAKKASRVLSFIPTIKMIAVTGSLAMGNSTNESDIDLIIVTKKGRLWTTRIITYLLLGLFGIKTRRAGNKKEQDKLCLNMWLDESDLIWRDRNLYTAHEITQIVPLVNKDNTYEKLLLKNKWVLKFWPNAVRINNLKSKINRSSPKVDVLEWIAFQLQRLYMKPRITREVVTPSRALFHPLDWGKVVLSKLSFDRP